MKILFIILTILFISSAFAFLRYVTVQTIGIIKLNKNQKYFTEFNSKIFEWVDEIKDPSIKDDFIEYVLTNWVEKMDDYRKDFHKIDIKLIIEEISSNIYLKYGNRIPSLVQYNRENRLKSINI